MYVYFPGKASGLDASASTDAGTGTSAATASAWRLDACSYIFSMMVSVPALYAAFTTPDRNFSLAGLTPGRSIA